MRFLATLAIVLTLSSACAHKAPIVVHEIVTVKAIPPPELLAPIVVDIPTFVAPSDPLASSALKAEDERLLRALINDLITRIQAWEAWGKADAPVEPPK